MKKDGDRRVRMTKRLLQEALLELLEYQEISSVSVTALCDAADVHRSTFYKYYSDPADLLEKIKKNILDHIPTPPQILDKHNQEQLLTEITAFFDFVHDNKKAFRILFNENSGSDFFASLVDFLCNGYVAAEKETDEPSTAFVHAYIANGTVGMLRKWILLDFPLDSHQIAEMMYFLSRKVNS